MVAPGVPGQLRDETVVLVPVVVVVGENKVRRKARLIDRMLDEFEEVYAPDEDAEGKLVMAVLRQAARLSS